MSDDLFMVGIMLLVSIALVGYLLTYGLLPYFVLGGGKIDKRFRRMVGLMTMVAPVWVLVDDIGKSLDCCHNDALFAPQHRLSVLALGFLCMLAFLYSIFRKKLAPPLLEVLVNSFLLLGIALTIVTALQVGTVMESWPFWVFGVVPVGFHFILALVSNHQLAMEILAQREIEDEEWLIALCRRVMFLPAWKKFPVLLVLCLPVLCVLAGALTLFGQKPDSMIRAFTDTYHHGLSQLDDQCAGVTCPGEGHYLCTIAAKGHPGLVRPIRMGHRAGKTITCNRQLLVSNAFEELLEQRVPGLHRRVRSLYNQIGAGIHRHYWVFDHAWVSDTIYVLMKPLEWGFVVVLYLCDRRPEDRIASQYLRKEDRVRLDLGKKVMRMHMGRSGECDEVQGLA